MTGSLVSIITPAYNHGSYISRCLDSVLAQTHRNWELIVVDDGSTDDTAAVVARYTDPRISYVHQANRGVGDLAGTLNVGLHRTTGPLVTMLASDDTWPPQRLAQQIPVFDDTKVVLCFGRGIIIDENDQVVGEAPGPSDIESRENRPPGAALRRMFLTNYIAQYTVLIRRSALERIGGYLQPKGLYAEDYPTHMRLAFEGEFRFLDVPLGNYRMHANQMTRTHFHEMVQTDVAYVLKFFRDLSRADQARSGWTEPELARALEFRRLRSSFEIGRRYLLTGEWSKARASFAIALRHGDTVTRAKAAVGLVCAVVRTDLEWLAGLTGRPRLR